MFIKEDFIRYFQQVSDIEKKMLDNIEELFLFIKDETSVAILKKIHEDEIKHIGILKKIDKIITESDI